MAKDRAASRRAQLSRCSPPGGGPPAGLAARAASAVAAGALRATYLVSDHHRNALMLAVFGFKVGQLDGLQGGESAFALVGFFRSAIHHQQCNTPMLLTID